MLILHFEGWFQCRLATNPDPTDEARGVSGYTFALPGEDDLDRVIRLHDPRAPRSHGPAVGVHVTGVERAGVSEPSHPLREAPVFWLGDPKFESRNRLLSDDRSGTGPIHPFHVRVAAADVVIDREDLVYPPDPTRPLHELHAAFLNRRAPARLDGFETDADRVRAATGIASPAEYRRVRMLRLEAERVSTTHATARAALEKRIEQLAIDDHGDVRLMMMHAVQTWRFDLNGPAVVVDPQGLLGWMPDASSDWPVEFWMGAWDADALVGFVSGSLAVPGRPAT